MPSLLLALYLIVLVLLSLHGAHRLVHLGWWRRAGPPPTPPPLPDDLPVVTVQLPVYNERDVVERLVDAVAALDWPADRLQIQLLDDSTDDIGARAAPALARARARGIDAVLFRRPQRQGYKAGALAFGLTQARGDILAIFDADFLPPTDFLRRTVPHLLTEGVGLVQCRWGHLNEGGSALTRAQATLLDGHFVVEQVARHTSGAWFNFNGTAGVWRRAAIEAAGGWQADTLTEDLDLSYRAQLAGWRFVFLTDAVVPAELPDTASAFATQQRRWARGSIETFRKLGARVARAQVPLRVRVEALSHLGANLAWPLVVLLSTLLPLVVMTRGSASAGHWWLDLPGFVFSIGVHTLFYTGASGGRLRRVPLVLALAVGMAVSQAVAVFEAFGQGRVAFERTPKNGGGTGSYRGASRGTFILAVELVLAALNLVTATIALGRGQPGSVPFLLLFGAGYAWVAGMEVAERWGARPEPMARREVGEPVAGT